MAEHPKLYTHARYYDMLFARDVRHEVAFMAAVYTRLNQRSPEAALDLGCGPGYHARGFAAHHMRSVGLDVSPAMIACARRQTPDSAVRWVVADMRDFQLDEPVDLACVMLGGLSSLLSNQDIVRHLRAVAANLRPGGVYLIDMPHPRERALLQRGDRLSAERDGCQVQLEQTTSALLSDPQAQTSLVDLTIRVSEQGREQVLTDQMVERVLFAQELAALAELSGVFRVVDWYGDYDLRQPFDASPAARRMIGVLQKVASAPERRSSYVSPRLEVRVSAKADRGMFAVAPIAAGELLLVWGGQVISTQEAEQRGERYQHHSLQVDEGVHLLAAPEPADYVNHSCTPNAGLRGQISLVALRAIEPGEEICYDYVMSEGSAFNTFPCNCGTPACRGRVTADDWRLPELQARYAGHFSPYLQRRIDALATGGARA